MTKDIGLKNSSGERAMVNSKKDEDNIAELIIPTLHPVFAKRQAFRANAKNQQLWQVLDQVFDPELPGVTLWDLGVLQDIQCDQQQIIVLITPTYSGCPAVDAMSQDVVAALNQAGFESVSVKVVLAPAWNTDMISPAGKEQLKALNIAPPDDNDHVECPVCASHDTQVLSQFGSTACKALYRCQNCLEVFDYFKKLL